MRAAATALPPGRFLDCVPFRPWLGDCMIRRSRSNGGTSSRSLPALPRVLVGGHLVSTVVGLLTLQLAGPVPWVAPFAVGLAIIAMHLTRPFHPPAGIDPLVVVVNDMPWSFLLAPVGAGALILAVRAAGGRRGCGVRPQRVGRADMGRQLLGPSTRAAE